ncbi:hypothetical protein SISSUDRAFT_1067984, partial [Sistotremastrum suecicum HHB10207 ss-3]
SSPVSYKTPVLPPPVSLTVVRYPRDSSQTSDPVGHPYPRSNRLPSSATPLRTRRGGSFSKHQAKKGAGSLLRAALAQAAVFSPIEDSPHNPFLSNHDSDITYRSPDHRPPDHRPPSALFDPDMPTPDPPNSLPKANASSSSAPATPSTIASSMPPGTPKVATPSVVLSSSKVADLRLTPEQLESLSNIRSALELPRSDLGDISILSHLQAFLSYQLNESDILDRGSLPPSSPEIRWRVAPHLFSAIRSLLSYLQDVLIQIPEVLGLSEYYWLDPHDSRMSMLQGVSSPIYLGPPLQYLKFRVENSKRHFAKYFALLTAPLSGPFVLPPSPAVTDIELYNDAGNYVNALGLQMSPPSVLRSDLIHSASFSKLDTPSQEALRDHWKAGQALPTIPVPAFDKLLPLGSKDNVLYRKYQQSSLPEFSSNVTPAQIVDPAYNAKDPATRPFAWNARRIAIAELQASQASALEKSFASSTSSLTARPAPRTFANNPASLFSNPSYVPSVSANPNSSFVRMNTSIYS